MHGTLGATDADNGGNANNLDLRAKRCRVNDVWMKEYYEIVKYRWIQSSR